MSLAVSYELCDDRTMFIAELFLGKALDALDEGNSTHAKILIMRAIQLISEKELAVERSKKDEPDRPHNLYAELTDAQSELEQVRRQRNRLILTWWVMVGILGLVMLIGSWKVFAPGN